MRHRGGGCLQAAFALWVLLMFLLIQHQLNLSETRVKALEDKIGKSEVWHVGNDAFANVNAADFIPVVTYPKMKGGE